MPIPTMCSADFSVMGEGFSQGTGLFDGKVGGRRWGDGRIAFAESAAGTHCPEPVAHRYLLSRRQEGVLCPRCTLRLLQRFAVGQGISHWYRRPWGDGWAVGQGGDGRIGCPWSAVGRIPRSQSRTATLCLGLPGSRVRTTHTATSTLICDGTDIQPAAQAFLRE